MERQFARRKNLDQWRKSCYWVWFLSLANFSNFRLSVKTPADEKPAVSEQEIILNTPLKPMSPVTVDPLLTSVKTSFSHKHLWVLVMTGGAPDAVLHLPLHYSHNHSWEFSILCNSQTFGVSCSLSAEKKAFSCGFGWMIQSCRHATWLLGDSTYFRLDAKLKSLDLATHNYWKMLFSCVFWSSAKLSWIIYDIARIHAMFP